MSSTFTASPFAGKTFGVTVANLSKRFGKTSVLKEITLDVKPGEIFCIMGRPEFILVLTERDDKGYKRMVYDTDWQPVDFHWKVSPPVPEKPMPRPALLNRASSSVMRRSA